MANKCTCYHLSAPSETERAILLALRRLLETCEYPATKEIEHINALLEQPEPVAGE